MVMQVFNVTPCVFVQRMLHLSRKEKRHDVLIENHKMDIKQTKLLFILVNRWSCVVIFLSLSLRAKCHPGGK
jgi:hypothetical protein